MAAEHGAGHGTSPTDYISHHLGHLKVGEGFWTFHIDTLVMSAVMGAIVVFVLGSVLCGLSQSMYQLVGARILQGIGGAMMVPIGRLVILRSVSKAELVSAMAYLTVPALLGPVVGPPIGGFDRSSRCPLFGRGCLSQSRSRRVVMLQNRSMWAALTVIVGGLQAIDSGAFQAGSAAQGLIGLGIALPALALVATTHGDPSTSTLVLRALRAGASPARRHTS